MTREDVVARLQKLMAHAESAKQIGNLAEAEAFATKCDELLSKYNLGMDDLAFKRHQEDEPIERETFYPDEFEIKHVGQRVAWQELLAVSVAQAHDCRLLVWPNSNRITFVGRATNRAATMYVYSILLKAAEEISDREYVKAYYQAKKDGDVTAARGFKASFLQSFVLRIRSRYYEERRKREDSLKGQSTALVRINTERAAVEQWMADQKASGKTKSASRVNGRSAYNSDGIGAGRRAADGMSLHANGLKPGAAGAKAALGKGQGLLRGGN